MLSHDFCNVTQCLLHRLDGLRFGSIAQGNEEDGLAVGCALSVWVVGMVDEVFDILAALGPIADLAVVHESPILPNEGMAIVSGYGSTCGGSDVGEK